MIPDNFSLEPVGRNTKYDSSMCDLVKAIARSGGFHAAMIMACGISKKTFYKWQDDYEEFKEAVEEADTISLAFQEKCLVEGMLGNIKNYNFSANAMILNNKYKTLYTKSGDGPTTEININTINLTQEQIDDKIAQKLEKLGAAGKIPASILKQMDKNSESGS